MRTAIGLTLLTLLGGCASGRVVLLPGEAGAPVGSVAVLNPKTEAEQGALTTANTQTALGSRVSPRPADAAAYAALTDTLPLPGARFTLYFVEGTTQITAESEPVLAQLFDEVAKRPGVEVQITGHTDTFGSDADNDALSLRRAKEIRDALVEKGLNPNITRSVGRGERELLVATGDGVREDKNRRVEITVR